MNIQNNRQNSHDLIDHIFKDLLPAHGMGARPAQIALSHEMLDAMLDHRIALCDAGTGIGKTYAYLVAGTVFHRSQATGGPGPRPILISTSSIALQNAVEGEYLPFLSAILLEDGVIDRPLRAVIRKGKAHYVCDERLKQRLGRLNPGKKNPQAMEALLSLRERLDMDGAVHLNGYDRERVCVPAVCGCGRDGCRYLRFLDTCDSGRYLFQICNHNLLLADAIHGHRGRRPILPEHSVLIMDEAHKLPETARQMFGVTLAAVDIRGLITALKAERFVLAAETLEEAAGPLLREMAEPWDGNRPVDEFFRLLLLPGRVLPVICRQLHRLLAADTHRKLEAAASAVSLFCEGDPALIFYTAEDERGGTMLCAAPFALSGQLRAALWGQPIPMVLTSGTLAVGHDFRRFKEETGLLTDGRVTESVSLSPFDYRRNCLLYLPRFPPCREGDGTDHYEALADEIAGLLKAAHGHALVLFTSYAAMSAVKALLADMGLPFPLFTMGRNAAHATGQFRNHPGSVLLATGAAWEGFDFPGDCVSLLVIPRLPFACPDAWKEKERENYPSLRAFIRAVVVPEMQIKLKQGFGRAIRTEADTCVVAILDERAARGRRYHGDVRQALPEMRSTSSLRAVERFLRSVKGPDYFTEGAA